MIDQAELLKAPTEKLPDLIGQLESLKIQLEARYRRAQAEAYLPAQKVQPAPAGPDRILKASQAAKMLGRSTKWLHMKKRELPFAHQLEDGGWVYSEKEIAKYLKGC